jgi:hypothetical protein
MHRLVAARRRHGLEGKRADTYWTVRAMLREFGAVPVTDRVVVEGRLLTAAGASSGIDMPLRPVGMEAGDEEARALHLVIEYDPDPLFDSGSLGKADGETQRRATEHMARATEEAR